VEGAMKLEAKLLLWCQEAVTRLAEDIRLAWVLREFRKEGSRLQTPRSGKRQVAGTSSYTSSIVIHSWHS